MKEIIGAVIITFVALIGLLGFIGFMKYMESQDKLKECEDYYEYGYITEFHGSSIFDYVCLIVMEDGTKMPLKDWKVVSIKKPMVNS